jgi:hypothetical protein
MTRSSSPRPRSRARQRPRAIWQWQACATGWRSAARHVIRKPPALVRLQSGEASLTIASALHIGRARNGRRCVDPEIVYPSVRPRQQRGLTYLFRPRYRPADRYLARSSDVHESSVREIVVAGPRRATTTERPGGAARHSAVCRSNARSRSTGSGVSVTSFSISTPQPMQKN